MRSKRYEVLIGSGPSYADLRLLRRYERQEEGEEAARRMKRLLPGSDVFIFHHVTQRTRLLCFHTLRAGGRQP